MKKPMKMKKAPAKMKKASMAMKMKAKETCNETY